MLEVLATSFIVCLRYPNLPPLIPSPFNGGGDAHGMAGKAQLWALLVIMAFVYLLLTGISRMPHLPVNVSPRTSPEAIAVIRRQAIAMLLGLKVLIMAIFLLLASCSTGLLSPALTHKFVGLLITAMFLVTLINVVRLYRTGELPR